MIRPAISAPFLCGTCALLFSVGAPAQETTDYAYDARGRVTQAQRTQGGTVKSSANYSYDDANNRNNVTVTAAGQTIPASFSISDASVAEGGTLAFTVTKSNATAGSLSVFVSTANGSATSGVDYTAYSSTLTFAAAETAKTINVVTANNGIVDGTRVLYANLSNASAGSAILDMQGSGTINDNEVAVTPSFSIGDASATEGGDLAFTVTKSGLTGSTFSINYASANQTATAPADYLSASGTLTFLPAETSKAVVIPTSQETSIENNETFRINLSGASGGATISDPQAIGTIVSDDGVGFSISNANTVEGGIMTFTVTKTGPTTSTLTINYATAYGTATSDDFTAKSGTLTFAPADQAKGINVTTHVTPFYEDDEVFTLNLSQGTGTYTITDGQGVGTISEGGGSCSTCLTANESEPAGNSQAPVESGSVPQISAEEPTQPE
jgi:YD repeat-containing protein